MSAMHPPANRRCQIYSGAPGDTGQPTLRCRNEGTHWVKWGGCGCGEPEYDVCEQDFYSWECDQPCEFVEVPTK